MPVKLAPKTVSRLIQLAGAMLAAGALLAPPAAADRMTDLGCDRRLSWTTPDLTYLADPYEDAPVNPFPTYPGALEDNRTPNDGSFDSCDIHFRADQLGYSPKEPFDLDAPAVSGIAEFATYKLNNTGFGMETEPTEGGTMTRSLWMRIPKDAAARRIVLHTFGSSINTVMVVYSFNGGLVRVAGNNDFAVPGISTTQSLVQFDAAANTNYYVQLGSIASAQGDISLNAFAFDAGGGLAAFLIDSGGNTTFNGRDYTCATLTCPTAKFVVYNAMGQGLTVTPSTTLPTRFVAPAPFALASGAVAVSDFTSTATTDFTVRTEIARLEFSGAAGGPELTRATFRAIAKVGGSPSTTLQMAVLPAGRATQPNKQVTGFATVINSGTQPAIGCVLRAQEFGYYKSHFQETNPATNLPIGQPDTPVTIAAGATRTFVFAIQSQATELGDPTFASGPIVVDCASQAFAAGNIANAFSLTATHSFEVADMISIGVTPSGDGILNVPSGAGAAFPVATVNIGANRSINARAVYVAPFGEPANQAFTAFICETNPANGQCLAPPSASVTFSALRNVTHTFTAFVQRPVNAPAFDPGQRRIVVEFRQMSTSNFFGQNAIPVSVGSTSAAVRAQ